MKKWVCQVCGYIYEGDTAPEECPVCHVVALPTEVENSMNDINAAQRKRAAAQELADKTSTFQTLVVQEKAITIPTQYFYTLSVFAKE